METYMVANDYDANLKRIIENCNKAGSILNIFNLI